jgi:hypothetical protein
MIEKRLNVIVVGSDRQLWKSGTLRVRVSDIFASGGPRLLFRGTVSTAAFECKLQLPFDAGQVYGLDIRVSKHRPAWYLVRRKDFLRGPEDAEHAEATLRLMLVPNAPVSSDLDLGFARLLAAGSPFAAPSGGIPETTYDNLAAAAKMAFLNIESKLRATFVDGVPLLSLVAGIRHAAVDRVFLFMRAAAKEAVTRSREFAGAAGHEAPDDPPGLPDHHDSWKHTAFAEGNVQLSFSESAFPFGTAQELCHSVDVDIDLGRGLAHVVEWLENNVFEPGHTTDPTIVYAQLFNQGILPFYTLDPVAATTAASFALKAVLRRRRKPRARGRAGARRPKRRSATTAAITKKPVALKRQTRSRSRKSRP